MRTPRMSSRRPWAVATLAALMMSAFASGAHAQGKHTEGGIFAVSEDACEGRKPALVYFATHAIAMDFWSTVEVGAREGARDACIDIKWTQDVNFSVMTTIERMETAVAEEPDVLIITATEPVAMRNTIERARKKGIPIIAINTEDVAPDQGGLDYMIYIGESPERMGYTAADQVIKRGVKPVIKPVCLNSFPGHVGLEFRCKGFADRMAEEGIETSVLDVSGGVANAEGALGAYLIANPESNAFFTFSATFDTTLAVLTRTGRIETSSLVTSELNPQITESIKAGTTLAAIDQQPYLQGYLAAILARAYVDWGLMPGADIVTGPGIVSIENVDVVIAGAAAGRR